MDWKHGGDVWEYERENGSFPLDFSANISPLGMPEGIRKAAVRALEQSELYPDPFCRNLRRELSLCLGVPEEQILCGNGASDLIFRVCAAKARRISADRNPEGGTAESPGTALVTAPAFSEYERALRLYGFEVRRFLLLPENDFVLTKEILARITTETAMVFLGNPNNPTGRTVPPELLARILERCRSCGTLLVLDESFAEFLEDSGRFAPGMLSGGLPGHLLILRSFTKLYGMAGLRLGYCVSADEALLEDMAAEGAPWAVSNVAQAAGTAALRETEFVRRLREMVSARRPALAEGLASLGLRVIPGEANYLLFYCEDHALGDKLAQRGIRIRDCRDYHGLGPGWFRTAVRTEEENRQLLRAAREILC